MAKVTNTTEENIRASIGSIYAGILSKRQMEKDAKAEQKRMEEERRRAEKEEKKDNEEETKLTKKEKRQAELDNWKAIVVDLTGDDLEYSSGKKNKKKKYKKWIGEEDETASIQVKKKKVKKKNYHKEFEPELNMLRVLVAEQNRFTTDLQRRFAIAAGPANKDAAPPNKTMVELAAAITSGRSNSLGMLREIGSLKKSIADLYMKQKKLDLDIAGGGSSSVDNADIALMGSNIANSLLNGPIFPYPMEQPLQQPIQQPVQQYQEPTMIPVQNNYAVPPQQNIQVVQAAAFDPSTWDGPTLKNEFTKFENIPHDIIVERNNATGNMRFAAIRKDNGEEIHGCNIPTCDPMKLKINEKDMTVKGQFDEVYRLVTV